MLKIILVTMILTASGGTRTEEPVIVVLPGELSAGLALCEQLKRQRSFTDYIQDGPSIRTCSWRDAEPSELSGSEQPE